MEVALVPIREVLKKGVWHYQPYSQSVREAEAILEQSLYPVCPLQELVEVGSVKRGFSPRASHYLEAGVPFIRQTNLKSTLVDFSEVAYISQADHQKLHQSEVHRGDVLVGLVATAGPINIAVYQSDQPANINQNVARIRPIKETLIPDYLVYYMRSKLGQTLLQSRLTGSVIRAISLSSLIELPIIHPPVGEQDFIVSRMRSLQRRAQESVQDAEIFQHEAHQQFDRWLKEGVA